MTLKVGNQHEWNKGEIGLFNKKKVLVLTGTDSGRLPEMRCSNM